MQNGCFDGFELNFLSGGERRLWADFEEIAHSNYPEDDMSRIGNMGSKLPNMNSRMKIFESLLLTNSLEAI